MNFSEIFKQTGQHCTFSPDGNYLVSLLEILHACQVMNQFMIYVPLTEIHIDDDRCQAIFKPEDQSLIKANGCSFFHRHSSFQGKN